MGGKILRGTLVVLGVLMLGIAWWVWRAFGPVSLIQLWLNLPKVEGDLNATERGYIWHFIIHAFVIPLVLLLLVVGPLASWRRRHPIATGRRGPRWWPAVTTALVGATVLSLIIGVPGHIRWLTSSTTMQPYYVTPVAANDQPNEKPKNLVVIYLESMETAFADDTLFETNMLEPLEDATAGWSSVDDLRIYDSGGWTMAGIVGTECGVPLRGPSLTKNDVNPTAIGWEQNDFLPGATCLGDVLSEAGYTSVFMGGADANFANKARFLNSHGYDEILDLHTWQDLGETEMSSWGLSDARLMEHAKAEVTRLREAGQPFQLTALTLDSHDPAHLFPSCKKTTKEEMTSVIKCSMTAVAGFVNYLDDQGYLDDTVVLLVGDHPKMVGVGGTYYDELGHIRPQKRPLFNRIWSPDGPVPIERQDVDQLSLYPTLLDLLDLGEPDHRAGVGVSALVRETTPGSILDLSPKAYRDVVRSRSADMYQNLWSSPDQPGPTGPS